MASVNCTGWALLSIPSPTKVYGMKPSPSPALTGPSIRSAPVAQTRSDALWLGTVVGLPNVDIPSAPLPRIVTKGVPTLRERPPSVRVMGSEFSKDP